MKSFRKVITEAITDVPEMGPDDVRRELYNALYNKHLHRIHHKRIFDIDEQHAVSDDLKKEGMQHYNTSVSYGIEALHLHKLLKQIDPTHNVQTHWDLESKAKSEASKAHYGVQTS